MGMAPELKKSIDDFIASNKVVVFMKGEKASPQVGSITLVRLLVPADERHMACCPSGVASDTQLN